MKQKGPKLKILTWERNKPVEVVNELGDGDWVNDEDNEQAQAPISERKRRHHI